MCIYNYNFNVSFHFAWFICVLQTLIPPISPNLLILLLCLAFSPAIPNKHKKNTHRNQSCKLIHLPASVNPLLSLYDVLLRYRICLKCRFNYTTCFLSFVFVDILSSCIVFIPFSAFFSRIFFTLPFALFCTMLHSSMKSILLFFFIKRYHFYPFYLFTFFAP